MKMGTMALIGTMLLTPASNVFAADEVQEVAVFDDGSETKVIKTYFCNCKKEYIFL